MAIVKMKFVSACTDREHLDKMLQTGMNSSMLHAETASNIINEDNQGQLLSDDNPYNGYRQTLQNIAHSLNYSLKVKDKSEHSYSVEEIDGFIDHMNTLFGLETDSANVILTPDDEKALAELSVCGFERMHACQYVNFGFGRLPKESFKKLSMYKDEIFVHHRLHENNQYVWMVYATSDSYMDKINKIFKDLYFEPIDLPDIDVQKELKNHSAELDDVYTYCTEMNGIRELYSYIAVLDKKNILSGFVRAEDLEKYEQLFKDQPVDFRVKDPAEVPYLKCPTLLKNNWFAKPFELFLSMYGVPKYGDFDPTGFLAVTYSLLFGVMFGDLGQGLILAVIGLLLQKKGALFGIIGRCGITSMIFGFLFGSVFGFEDLLNPIHQSLFGVREKLFDVMDTSNTMTLLMCAIFIGMVLILTTQTMNIVNRIKHKKYGEAFFSPNGLAGLVFYASAAFAIVGTMLLKLNVLNPFFIIVFLVLPVVLMIMKEPLTNAIEHKTVKPREGWGGYIVQECFEMLDTLLTFFSNSMSYLRVGGFVLSHAGMMLVVMTLVKMTGNAGIVVLIIGNIFVMLLEGLVVGIQTLRLEYYEMFSRYYDAGGIPFKALSADTAE